MKYENFDKAAELVKKIKKLEELKKELSRATLVLIQEGGNYRSLSISLVVENEPYSDRAKGMVQWIVSDIEKEIKLLTIELAML